MSRLSRYFGRWVGRKLIKAISPGTTAQRCCSSIAMLELLRRVSELESLMIDQEIELATLRTSLSILHAGLASQPETISAPRPMERTSQESTDLTTEASRPSKASTK